jgi:hypothetical protein
VPQVHSECRRAPIARYRGLKASCEALRESDGDIPRSSQGSQGPVKGAEELHEYRANFQEKEHQRVREREREKGLRVGVRAGKQMQ